MGAGGAERPPRCVLCGLPCRPGLACWHWCCSACGLEMSTLDRPEHNAGPLQGWTPAAERNLEPLRAAMAARILDAVLALAPPQAGRLLDVGCAGGWFLAAARARGFEAVGIEPDPEMARRAAGRGLAVTTGLFPEALAPTARFDLVSFNDVLEHLPDPDAALAAVARHGNAGAVLVCTVPDRDGVIYRIAGLLARCGFPRAFERCWQRGYESPHRYYFSAAALAALAAPHGFMLARRIALPAYRLRGAWARLRESFAPPSALLAYCALALLRPFLGILPADAQVLLFRRRA